MKLISRIGFVPRCRVLEIHKPKLEPLMLVLRDFGMIGQ
jgi:hypothetical protein